MVKNPSAVKEMQEMWVQSLGREDLLEEEIAIHSSILAWKIPGQRSLAGYIGSHRVGHDGRDLACVHIHVSSVKSKKMKAFKFYHHLFLL